MRSMPKNNAVVMLAWARLWSPLADDVVREDAWTRLGLPGSFAAASADYWSLCHGPEAAAPALLHAGLGREDAALREDMLRVMEHLGLVWDECHVPPDQLGVACDVLAYAIDAEETALVRELCAHYLLPWCDAMQERISADSPIAELVAEFRSDATYVMR
jgi:TorA maturation chaperone TorD